MSDNTAIPISAVGDDPRQELVYAAQQCADAAAQLLTHHIESDLAGPRLRLEEELIDRLAEALRTACEVEQDALAEALSRSNILGIAIIDQERTELGQLAAACSKFLLRGTGL